MRSGNVHKREAVFWVLLGVCISFLGWRVKVGNFHAPGPGFFALVAGLALIIIGLLMLLSKSKAQAGPMGSINAEADAGARRAQPAARLLKRRLVPTLGLLVAYALFLNIAGYILCTFVVMWGLFYDWGKNRLVNSCIASLATTGVTYLIFETWLRTQLPRGVFPWW